MPGRKNRSKKRKKGDVSLESLDNSNVNKAGRFTRTPEGVSVSQVLGQANSILFDSDDQLDLSSILRDNSDIDTSCNSSSSDISGLSGVASNDTPPTLPTKELNMDTNNKQTEGPTNADIMTFLKGLESKFVNLDKRLEKLETLDKKIDSFEAEMKKLWVHVNDKNRQIEDRVIRVEEKTDSTDFSLGVVNEKVTNIEKERDILRDEVIYLQSQSMRNNLMFGNIPEADLQEVSETATSAVLPENTEQVLRDFLVAKMKIASTLVEKMQFERVHRVGPKQQGSRGRKIVAKFSLFKEREFVRKQSKALKGTNFFVQEQFPKEVNDKRRRLLPQMKEARKAGKPAWLAYDTLYVDGKPVRLDR